MSRHPFNFLLPVAESLEHLERMVSRPAEVRRTINFCGTKIPVKNDNRLPDGAAIFNYLGPWEMARRSRLHLAAHGRHG